jgi:hypothetical protein
MSLEKYLEQIKAAADEAQDKIDYDAAHDDEILFAIDIVEHFLRRTKRICYGGQAINAYLPDKYKFYDPLRSIPDYDFLTPNGAEDIKILVAEFKKAGYTDIGVRPGMHEGTTKIYINYTPVADVTEINSEFYGKLYERSKLINTINYIDINSLKMMMYLELSRPRGEVERWEKVFVRLELLNRHVPMECDAGEGRQRRRKRNAYEFERRKILDFIIYEQRVFVGGDIVQYYSNYINKKKQPVLEWLIGGKQPVLFYSPNALQDAFTLRGQLEKHVSKDRLKVLNIAPEAEFFPQVIIVELDGEPLSGIVQETACHAYNTLQLSDGTALRIASFETLITLYISLTFKKNISRLFDKSLLCMAQKLIELQHLYRNRKKAVGDIPFISITCSGHQKQLPSLLREKVQRIKAAKKTMRRSQSQRPSGSRSRTMKARAQTQSQASPIISLK